VPLDRKGEQLSHSIIRREETIRNFVQREEERFAPSPGQKEEFDARRAQDEKKFPLPAAKRVKRHVAERVDRKEKDTTN